MDYDEKPLLVYWEMTRACDLACQHCRAEAMPWHHPQELSTEEGYDLLDKLAGFGDPKPHLVLTGGDPLKRPDLFPLISYAKELGFTVAVTPAGTQLITQDTIQQLREAGAWMLALSLDGSDPKRHDGIRGVPGSFDLTLQAARWTRSADIPLQVNTLVCAQTVDDLPEIFARVSEIGVTQWALFFLIQVGRGEVLQEVTPDQSEEVMHWAHEIGQKVAFAIRTTEAPHYRRLVLQQATAQRREGNPVPNSEHVRRGFGVRDGSGIMFISHTGEIYPSGFLPIATGRVRDQDPVEVYRQAPLFRALRDPDRLKGKCGVCEYRQICGGSRARAFAATGDPLESDPLCPYEPVAETPKPVVGAMP